MYVELYHFVLERNCIFVANNPKVIYSENKSLGIYSKFVQSWIKRVHCSIYRGIIAKSNYRKAGWLVEFSA